MRKKTENDLKVTQTNYTEIQFDKKTNDKMTLGDAKWVEGLVSVSRGLAVF